MKIKMPKDYKDTYTLADVERAKAVIACEKEDEETAAGYAMYAINEATRDGAPFLGIVEIIKAEATTAKNCRVWNAYGDDTMNTETMDVWIEATAETSYGFIKVGAYLTDIWQTGSEEYRQHEYIRIFEEVAA